MSISISEFKQEFGEQATYYASILLKVEHLLRKYVLPEDEMKIDPEMTHMQNDLLQHYEKMTPDEILYGVILLLPQHIKQGEPSVGEIAQALFEKQ